MQSRTHVHTVFATAQLARIERTADEVRRVPASQAHAKMMGTMTTLCGISTLSWHKFWELPFVKVRGDRCQACATVTTHWLASGKAR